VVKRRIWVVATDASGCWYYRLHLPLLQLNPDEFEVIWEPPYGRYTDGDIVLGQRIAGHNEEWQQMCADPRVTTVYDLDDDLLNIDPANAVPYGIYAPIAQATSDNIAAANLVTVSTPKLAKKISNINARTRVLPNCVHPQSLTPLGRERRFTIGWAGSMFHGQDMGGLPEQLQAFHRAHPYTDWHFCGADYSGNVVPHRVSPFQSMAQYHTDLDFSVGIAVLSKTPFNDKKSWIKVLEYAAKGIPAVATNIGQYPDFIDHGVNGYLMEDISELASYLELFVDDEHRNKLSDAAFAKANDCSITKHIGCWEQAYREATP
jgi:glycosyltransferase involved in cell wall biosynthesis